MARAQAARSTAAHTQQQEPITREVRGKLTVACKIPNGLVLRPCRMVSRTELVMGGGHRDINQSEPIPGAEIHLNGPGHEAGKDPKARIAGGYALTFNVDAENFNRWLEDNKDSQLVREKQVFAFDQAQDTVACAREHESVRSGLEGIDPDNPGKRVKGVVKGSKQSISEDDPTVTVPV